MFSIYSSIRSSTETQNDVNQSILWALGTSATYIP